MASTNPVFAIELNDGNRYGTVHKIGCRDLVDPEEVPFGEDPHQSVWPESDPTPDSMFMPCTKGLVNHRTDLSSLEGFKTQAAEAAKAVRRLSRTASWDDAVHASQLIASGIFSEHVEGSSLLATTVEKVDHLHTDSSAIHKSGVLQVTLFHATTTDDRDWIALADSNINYQLNPEMFHSYPVGLTIILSPSGRSLSLMYINRERDYCYTTLAGRCEGLLLELFNSTNVHTNDSMESALSTFFAGLLEG